MFVAPNPGQNGPLYPQDLKMVASRVLALVNAALRTVIAEEKVNAAAYSVNVPHMAVVNVNQIMTVVLICIVVSTDITRTITCADVAASERHAVAIQTVAHRTNIVSPGKYVRHRDFTVGKTLTAREMESTVKVANVLLNALGRALRLVPASQESVVKVANVLLNALGRALRLVTAR